MRSFRDVPIRLKLTILLAGIVGVAMLLACGSFVVNEVRRTKSSMADQVSVMAELLGANSVAALAFHDADSAEQVLSSLRLEPNVVFACIFDGRGEIFAKYLPAGAKPAAPPRLRREDDQPFFEEGYLHVFKPIVQDKATVGTVYLRVDTRDLYFQFGRDALIALVVLAFSLGAAILLASRLQRVISDPILRLVDASQIVSAESDFSIRVQKRGQDELGVLCDAFNSMLAQIQQRDAELEEHRGSLEQLVQERTRNLEAKTVALRESEERLNLALKSSGVGTWSWNVVENRIIWDDYIHPLFGLEPGTFPGAYEDFLRLLAPDDRERVRREVADAVERDANYDTEYRVVWNDGSVHTLGSRGMVYRDAQGRAQRMTGVCWDITERERIERAVKWQAAQLARLNSELQRSNVELEQFAYIASHDLQEPLRKVSAFGDMLASKYGDILGEEGRDYLQRMQNAAWRMKTLINDLLTYSRVTSKAQPFSEVDLAVVAREVASDLETRLHETGGRLEVGELPKLDAEPTQMRQLLQNLIGNALKYHQPGVPPVVKVDSRLRSYDQPPLAAGTTADPICEITVQDNGIGFEEKYADRIFAPFTRLHGRSEYEGTGMGLAVCRKIVERHGGTISAKSSPGQGATFLVTLPLRQPDKEQKHEWERLDRS